MPETRKTNTRLTGHELVAEGAPHNQSGSRIWTAGGGNSGAGRGRCSCQTLSEELPSGAARRRWHADHKEAVRSGVALDRHGLPISASSLHTVTIDVTAAVAARIVVPLYEELALIELSAPERDRDAAVESETIATLRAMVTRLKEIADVQH